jgi:NAD-dependent dihydropyrimidine dehydrogenase PreA subunit
VAYVIAEPCIAVKDTACVDACPVDCIHPKKDEPAFAEAEMLYIDPIECIDCGRSRVGLSGLGNLHPRRLARELGSLRAEERGLLSEGVVG